MRKKPRDNRPYIPPVKRVELSEKNVRLRLILIAVFLSIAVVAIGMGFSSALNVQPGWNQVQASSDTTNCSQDFKLMYDFSESGGSAAAVNKRLISLYTDATEQAFRLFSPDYAEEGLGNMAYLNAHVNEEVTVDEALYNAFSLLEAADNRCIYLAPVYAEYNRVFRSESDILAAENDPTKNPEAKAYVEELMSFISDPEMIRLELLGGNRVCLKVGEAYLSFARELELETFVDFGWMKNAFIADYIAHRLSAEGFTHGYLASFDGFTRNLDDRGGTFTQNLFHRQGNDVYMPGVMTYTGPRSIVFLRDFPLDDLDVWHYYAYENGDITSVMANPATGMSRLSSESLVTWSENIGCAEILMKLIPLYLRDTFSDSAINALREEGIHSLWFEKDTLMCNDPQQSLRLHENQPYTIVYTE